MAGKCVTPNHFSRPGFFEPFGRTFVGLEFGQIEEHVAFYYGARNQILMMHPGMTKIGTLGKRSARPKAARLISR